MTTSLPEHLDEDEAAWLTRELDKHPERADRIIQAVTTVHELHLDGGCS